MAIKERDETYQVSPGRMDILCACRDLLGKEQIVDAGEWGTPIYVSGTKTDMDALYQVLHEMMTAINDTELSRLSIRLVRKN